MPAYTQYEFEIFDLADPAKRWPVDGSAYAPGSFTITTGTAKIMAFQLDLSGTQIMIMEGTATLVIM